MDTAVAEVARRFAALGHEVHTQDRFDLPAVINQAVWPVLSQSGVAWLLHDRPGALDLVGPGARAMAEAGAALPATALVQALNTARRVQEAVQRLFEDFDLLLTPTAAAMPWPATEVYPPVIDGRPAGPRGHAAFTAFVNAAGVPALALPAPAAPDGLPIGFQLVGRHGDDALLCAIGAAYEAAHPWAHRWPPSPGDA
ncbi:amidase family protein [Aquabacterium sp. J223]|uniref:amidase family protein n=1 Tax=Aquabacterium sp. J223 TaxID=2898431 RepID=UPI0021AD83F7|nr:amidase family protein [Aquabacterium sp. J223]